MTTPMSPDVSKAPAVVTYAVVPAVADPNRHPSCQPGQYLYSAQMNRDKLACMYRCCFYCSTEMVTRRTFIDVYSNALVVNTPRGCCCCIWSDAASVLFYDNSDVFGQAVVGGCCSPCWYLCPHNCNCCGETLIIKRGCGCPNTYGHASYGHLCCCCPISVFCGIEQGQAEVLRQQVEDARARHVAMVGMA